MRATIEQHYAHLVDTADRETAAAEENVLFAVENLRRYPIVAQALESGRMQLHAWMFKIATAELFAFDPEARQFAPLGASS